MSNEFIRLETCPICGKTFVPAAQHIYRVNGRLVCTWGCQRKVEKEKKARKNEKQRGL